jgi:hypothetical protein
VGEVEGKSEGLSEGEGEGLSESEGLSVGESHFRMNVGMDNK